MKTEDIERIMRRYKVAYGDVLNIFAEHLSQALLHLDTEGLSWHQSHSTLVITLDKNTITRSFFVEIIVEPPFGNEYVDISVVVSGKNKENEPICHTYTHSVTYEKLTETLTNAIIRLRTFESLQSLHMNEWPSTSIYLPDAVAINDLNNSNSKLN